MKYIISMLCVMLISQLSAQHAHEEEIIIRGKIYTLNEEGEEEPVPSVKIYWKNDKHRSLSKVDGTFEIPALRLPDTLIVSSVGFEKQ